MGVVLFKRRKLGEFAFVCTIGVIVGALYFWFAYRITGDPLFNFKMYRAEDWASVSPVTIPFLEFGRSFKQMLLYPRMNLRTIVYVVLTTMLAAVGLIRNRFASFATARWKA